MSYDPRMQTHPSRPAQISPAALRVTLGCAMLFFLPFLAGGIGLIVTSFGVAQRQGWSQAAVPLLGGLAFVAMPLLIGGIIVYTLRKALRESTRRVAKPDEPWLWRDDWANGYVEDHLAARSFFLLGFAIVWNTIVAVTILVIWRAGQVHFQPAMLAIALFPLIGLGLLIAACYQLWRRHKYGRSRLRLNTVPIEPGVPFSGEVETHVTDLPENGFVLELRCLEHVTSARNSHESTLWSEKTTVPRGALTPSPSGTRVPFTLTYGPDAIAAARSARGMLIWRLHVSADVPGVDYASEFALPVVSGGRG